MQNPYEELEYLAEHLPEEGESLLVSREAGELVCKSISHSDLRSGIHDAELYGLLVRGNERLRGAVNVPVWTALIGSVWIGISLSLLGWLHWRQWFLVPGLVFPLLTLGLGWVRRRQRKVFRQEILPPLKQEMRRQGITQLALIAGVRQHSELRGVLDELVDWDRDGEFTLT